MGLKANAMREETINTTALREQIEGLRHMTVGQLKDPYSEIAERHLRRLTQIPAWGAQRKL